MKFGFEIIGGEGVRLFSLGFRFWWRGGVRLWVLDFGGVSDEERERDGKEEAVGGSEALHHGTVRQRDRE